MAADELTIKITDWCTDKDALSTIRRRVFIDEQHVPEEMEWDEFDNTAVHFLATIKNNDIACARLKTDGQIGRMAVLTDYRNQGVGYKLLQFLLQHADQQRLENLFLHAQTNAVAFYEKQGFVTQGDIFFEASIPHRTMLRKTC